MTLLWERTPPRLEFAGRLVMSPDQFHLMPVSAATEPEAVTGADLARMVLATEHGPRWHAVSRILRDGRAIVIARPISVRVYQAED